MTYFILKYKNLNQMEVYLTVVEIIRAIPGLNIKTVLTATPIKASIAAPLDVVSAFSCSLAILTTNENTSKQKLRYTNLTDFLEMITILSGKRINGLPNRKKRLFRSWRITTDL